MSASARRYALGQRYRAHVEQEQALENVWLGEQLKYTSTELPSTFPYLADLWYPPALQLDDVDKIASMRWYSTEFDVDGITVEELETLGFSTSEADTICAAVGEL